MLFDRYVKNSNINYCLRMGNKPGQRLEAFEEL